MKILRNILFFLLLFLVGFFLGILVAGLVDAGKGQMLAGGAIVLGYGVVGAGLGLVVALFISIFYKAEPTSIVRFNKILAIVLLCSWIYFYVQYQNRKAERSSNQNDQIGMLQNASDITTYKNNCTKQ